MFISYPMLIIFNQTSILMKDVCMKGMPKVKMFIKDSEDGNYTADYKLDFESSYIKT